ncbi:MAG: cyclic pyranopterin monophosphate synthase MoaC [Pseudomonadota bacterium]
MSDLSHIDRSGNAQMVDVSGKQETFREATAESLFLLAPETLEKVMSGAMPKGDVIATARIAGIQAAKLTGQLIPLCHPLPLEAITISFAPIADFETQAAIRVTATARLTGRTGIEMEAMTAVSVAALTLYDMVKAVDKGACIREVRLIAKSGGKSGSWVADTNHDGR